MEYKKESASRAEARVERVRKACGGAEMHPMTEAAKTTRRAKKSGGGTKSEMRSEVIFGNAAKKRLDRAGYKRGGSPKKGETEVNIIVSPNDGQQPMPGPMPMMPPMAAGRSPMPMPPPAMARPPMAVPPMAAGAPPGMPMRKSGGRVEEYTAGAGSGEGRLQKTEHAKADRGMKRLSKAATFGNRT